MTQLCLNRGSVSEPFPPDASASPSHHSQDGYIWAAFKWLNCGLSLLTWLCNARAECHHCLPATRLPAVKFRLFSCHGQIKSSIGEKQGSSGGSVHPLGSRAMQVQPTARRWRWVLQPTSLAILSWQTGPVN